MPAKPKARGRAPKNQHKLCSTLPKDELLTDLRKKSWRVGKAIGSGGFGLIYLADEGSKPQVADDALYVIKIEPESNGPLFCELAFYNRAAKAEQIDEWTRNRKVKFVGVPKYIAQGRHEVNGENLRFMVMPRFGSDLHNLWIKANKRFKRSTVSQIAIQMIDCLEYIHSREYTHADIKGSNILCDHKDPNKLFLVDYGLASRFSNDQIHKEFKPDPKKAHNGTIEYTSCDAHLGASPSRRGDFEILGFVLLHWFAGRLPWEKDLKNLNFVKDEKIKNMKDVDTFVKNTCDTDGPHEIIEFLQYVSHMKYDEKPDYDKTRNIFKKALKSLHVNLHSPIDFGSATNGSSHEPPKKITKKTKAKVKTPLQSKTNTSQSDDSTRSSDFTLNDSPPTPIKRGRPKVVKSKRTSKQSSSCSDVDKKPRQPVKNTRIKKRKPISETSETDNASDFSASEISVPVKRIKTTTAPIVNNSKNKKNHTKDKIQRSTKVSLRSSSSIESDELINNASLESFEMVEYHKVKEEIVPSEQEKNGHVSASPPKQEMVLKSQSRSSRHSMMPLHTKSVLTKSDKLTGAFAGKHPVIQRRRKVNVPKSNATTQTTPSLKRAQSRK